MTTQTVRVERNERGDWELALSGQHDRVRCATLDEARRLAYQHAARQRPCELVVLDAYHRVLRRDLVGDDEDDVEHSAI